MKRVLILAIFILGSVSFLFLSCKKKELPTPPIVSTSEIINITTVSAITGGEVLNSGTSTITERGICWSQNPNPKITDNCISSGKEIGKFSITLSNLVMETTYYVRAYAKNASGVGYGNEVSFTTAKQIVSKVTVKVENSSLSMGGETFAFASVFDEFGGEIPNTKVNWSTSDSSIASINTDGKILSEYDGEVYIKAVVGDKSDSTKIIIRPDYSNWKTFFKPVPNAFPDLNSYFKETSGSAFLTVLARLDLNKDGRIDLVFHLWHFRTATDNLSMALDAPVSNRLVALVAQNDGTLKDQTNQIFGSSAVDLAGGASRKVRIADLNGDGFPDWVYALNREDSRPHNGDWTNQSVAVLSNSNGTYQKVAFGEKRYHHSVEILPLSSGGFNILLDNDEEYQFQNNTFVKIPSSPKRGFGTYVVYSEQKSKTPNFLFSELMDDSYTKPNYLGLFKMDGGQKWEQQSIFKWENFKQIDYIDWAGGNYKSNVISYNGKEYISGGFYESVALRLYPNSAPVPIVHFATSYLPGGTQGRNFVNSNETQAWSKLMAFESVNGLLQEINIISDPEGPYNINFMDAKDINNDGYDDLITYPYIDGAKPRVYLNNQAGRLILINSNKLPQVQLNGSYNSAFGDIDGDGIEDLIFFPGNGCSCNNTCTTFLLYKGRKRLQ